MRTETIHYLWVGSPTKTDPLAIAGHDVAAPIKMATQLQQQDQAYLNNPMKFWCLEKHEKFYRQQFMEAQVNITVCSIEGLLKEESESDLASHAKFVQEYLGIALDNVKSRVEFKDLFSLFLLTCQPGYFFDTNVFPIPGNSVFLPGETTVATAKSGFQNTNDFFMMYSPERAHPTMRAILENWMTSPGFGNLSVFSVAKIPYIETEKQEIMGIKKISYKSYWSSNPCGLFYWVDRANRTNDITVLEENLEYGDINQRITYPSSFKTTEDSSLCYLKAPVTPENLLAMPFTTDVAYVATKDWNMYYVKKSSQTCVHVYQGCSTLFDIFPHPLGNTIKPATSRNVEQIINSLKAPIHPLPVANAADYSPAYIINTGNCTLLHHAVLINNAEQIRSLLNFGARCDIKATYQIKPTEEILELTPIELATYLNHHEIAIILQSNEEVKEACPVRRNSLGFFELPRVIECDQMINGQLTL